MEINSYQVVCVQNLVLKLGNWTELHRICVLKTAPKVPKRKTMLIYSLIIYFCFTYLVDEKFLKLSWVKKNILTALMNDSQKAGLQSFFLEWNQLKNAQTNLSRQIFYLFICNEIIFFLECSKWAKARHLAQIFSHRVEKHTGREVII